MNKLIGRKKGILTCIAAGSIVAAVAFNVSIVLSNSAQNDLFLANIHALARSESGYGDFPVCRCGEGYGEYKDGMKICENQSCKSKYARTGTLNVNYCTNCSN